MFILYYRVHESRAASAPPPYCTIPNPLGHSRCRPQATDRPARRATEHHGEYICQVCSMEEQAPVAPAIGDIWTSAWPRPPKRFPRTSACAVRAGRSRGLIRLWSYSLGDGHGDEWQQCQQRRSGRTSSFGARGLGIEVLTLEIRQPDDVGPALGYYGAAKYVDKICTVRILRSCAPRAHAVHPQCSPLRTCKARTDVAGGHCGPSE